jgi:hypothetical protein
VPLAYFGSKSTQAEAALTSQVQRLSTGPASWSHLVWVMLEDPVAVAVETSDPTSWDVTSTTADSDERRAQHACVENSFAMIPNARSAHSCALLIGCVEIVQSSRLPIPRAMAVLIWGLASGVGFHYWSRP